MVSFWPWKGDDNSPASFEKTLSSLSTKIAQATTRLDQQRQRARRFKALWTLYSTFAYLFYSIVLALVLGWQSWGVKEYAAIVGGPVLIYGIRTIGARLFEYRISRSQRHLDELNKQRDSTIEKLKVATKYNSTQQLLEKYGGETPKPSPGAKEALENRKQATASEKQQQQQRQQQHVARTGLPPPPTANIRRPPPPVTPQQPPPYQTPEQQRALVNTSPSPQSIPQQLTDEPGFAPNAFPSSGQYIAQSHWYDRLLDVLLGEDETQPRNRIVLICGSCRLVNGQAPPGIKSLEELGRWRCGSCGAWNGEESETTKMLSTLRQNVGPAEPASEPASTAGAEFHSEDGTSEGEEIAPSEEDDKAHRNSEDTKDGDFDGPGEDSKAEPVRRSKRGKNKQ